MGKSLGLYTRLLFTDTIALLSGFVGVVLAVCAYLFWSGQIPRVSFFVGSLISLQLASFRVWYSEHNQRLKELAAIEGPALDVEFLWHFGSDRADKSIELRNRGNEDAFNIRMSDMVNGTKIAKYSATVIPRVPKGEVVGVVPDEVITETRTISPVTSGWGAYAWTLAFFAPHDSTTHVQIPISLQYEDRFGRKYMTTAAIDYDPALRVANARFIKCSPQ
jgi:hypothetical protein